MIGAHTPSTRRLLAAALLGSTLVPGAALANPPDMFGLGGRAAAMGSASTGLAKDPSAVYYNMAGLSQQKQLGLMVGFQAGAYRLGDPSNCPASAPSGGVGCSEEFYYEHGGQMSIEQVRYGYEAPANVQFGLAVPVHPRVTLGIGGIVPLDVRYDEEGNFVGIGVRLAKIQTLDPYVPTYAMYRNRANHFAIYAGLGVEVVDGLHLGVGTSVSAGTTLNLNMGGDVYITSTPDSEETSATVTIAMNPQMEIGLKSSSAPTVGALWELGPTIEALDGLAVGLSFRGENKLEVATNVATDLTIWADLSDEPPYAVGVKADGITMALMDLYVPRQATLGLSGTFVDDKLTAAADITWSDWSGFKLPIATLGVPASDPVMGIAFETVPARDTAGLVFYDTWIPKVGVEYKLGPYLTSTRLRGMNVALRAGGSFEPNPIPTQSGQTNLLNSDRVTGTLGLGFLSGNPFMSKKDRPLSVDLFFQTHYLIPETHAKNPAFYQAADPTTVDGYPVNGAYVSKGLIYAGGLTAGFDF